MWVSTEVRGVTRLQGLPRDEADRPQGRTVRRTAAALLLVVALIAPTLAVLPWQCPMGDRAPKTGPSAVPPLTDPDVGTAGEVALAGLHGSFIENRGQLSNPEVRLYAQGDVVSAGFTTRGVIYTFHGGAPDGARDEGVAAMATPTKRTCSILLELGCPDGIGPVGVGPLGHPTNFLLSSDPARCQRGVPSYREVLYGGIRDGIDLRFRFADGTLKYDVIVSPGADTGGLALAYRGASGLAVDPFTGDLLITTPMGVLRDPRPVILQDRPGGRWSAPAEFVLLEGGSFGFALPAGLSHEMPFTIDPGLLASTLLGGTALDQCRDVVVGEDGGVYVCGVSHSPEFPTTIGANDTTPDTTWGDAFVVKFDPTLSTLLFSTFVGGPDSESSTVIELAPDGSICLLGLTSGDFPATSDALIGSYMGNYDVYFCKLSSDGSTLLYGTFIGGSGMDTSVCMQVGPGGDIFIAGGTNSGDLPCTPGAFCSTYGGTPNEWPQRALYAMRLDASLTRLEYCTYFNGLGATEQTSTPITGIYVDSEGNALLCGPALSQFPTTQGTVHPTYIGGATDGFLLELDPTGTRVLRSTFLGGSGTDSVHEISVSANGTVYVVGYSSSDDLDTTSDAPYRWLTGHMDMFVVALDRDLGAMDFCSYFGGRGDEQPCEQILTADEGALLFTGVTYSSTLRWTRGCYDPDLTGRYDMCVVSLNLTSRKFDYCTFLGGNGGEATSFEGLTLCPEGGVYMTGLTWSTDFPTTPGAYDTTYEGDEEGFAVLFDPTACDYPAPPANLTAVADDSAVRLVWAPHTKVGYMVINYLVYKGEEPGALEPIARLSGSVNQTEDTDVVNGKTYYYAVTAVNSMGEGAPNTTSARPLALPWAPTGLWATTGNATVSLNWSAPVYAGGELLGYKLFRGLVNGSLWPLATNLTATSFEDAKVSLGTTYRYAVAAFNSRGTGPATETIAIKAVAPPSPPRAFSVVPGDLSVDLAWEAPESDGGSPVLAYRIYRGIEDQTMSLLIERDPWALMYTDHVRDNGVKHYYYVTCRTSVGESLPSLTLEVVPFGRPGSPRHLVVTAGDGLTTLSWSPPLEDNGRPISDYVIYYGESPSELLFSLRTGNTNAFIHSGLTNGVTYFYEVAAVNEAGEGALRTETMSARPMGLPGAVTFLAGECLPGAIHLSWKAPADTGGATSLNYRLLRGTSEGDLIDLATLVDQETYEDSDIGDVPAYYYRVLVSSEIGEGPPSPILAVEVLTAPGPVREFASRAGNGYVNLTWSPPDDDGGCGVSSYIVLRGLEDYDLTELIRLGPVLSFNDTSLVNGVTCYYAVRAVNRMGTGPVSGTVNGTPLGAPGAPALFWFEVEDGSVVLLWEPPVGLGAAPVTGYVVMRGTSPTALEVIAAPGAALTYVDTEVERDTVYYYCVRALSSEGPGAASPVLEVTTPPLRSGTGGLGGLMVIVLVCIIGATVVAAALVVGRDRRRGAARSLVASTGSPAGVGGVPSVTVSTAPSGPAPSYLVEDVYLVHRDGRLIASRSRSEARARDTDLMSGMLIAVQGLVQDGMESESALESIKYGDDLILVATGEMVSVAVVIHGQPTRDLTAHMESTIVAVETTHGDALRGWTGDQSQIHGVEVIIAPLIEMTAHVERADLQREAAPRIVSVLSAVDFHRGYVRLKVAAVNSTPDVISDAAIEVRYDRDMLRLDRVEPDTLKLRGDRVMLGNVKPGERKTAALLFDPQICQGTHIDGALTYYDTAGEYHRSNMKRRHADVVCPIFFTRENANTAMLLRLVKEELRMSDMRVFRFPRTMAPGQVLDLGKSVLAGMDIQLVRECVVGGPPFMAEVWYYGVTKVKGHRFVMRLGVIEERSALEFFAASTVMEPITGLLAEFRRGLEKAQQERRKGEAPLELEMDEAVRAELKARPLMLDRPEWSDDGGAGPGVSGDVRQ